MRSKLTLIILLSWLGSTTSFGQSKGEIRGIILDSTTSEPLSLATVTLFNAADTSVVSYKLSDFKGEFRMTGLPLNLRSRLLITFSGYSPIRREVYLTDAEPVLKLDSIFLSPSSESLDEVVFTLERPPVLVKNDTIEFNASSFKTLPTALVEDLLKKLPGVSVDGDGNISVNGKRVNRILVDGKTFFGDDPKMASRNLPANLIDKVQVMDDKEEMDRMTDNNYNDIGKVINLTFKKDVKKGWFGKAYAGAGTEERYEVGGIANIFRDTLQLSLLAFSNNVNRSGFSMGDIQSLGGFNRSGVSSMAVYVDSRGQQNFALNGITFGGTSFGGVSRSSGGGFNLNHAPTSKKSFYLQYFIGENKHLLEDETYNRQFIKDSILDINTFNNAIKLTDQHNIGAGFTIKPNNFTNINFRASGNFSNTINRNNLLTETISNKSGDVSEGVGKTFDDADNFSYNHNLSYTQRFEKKKGRLLNISHNFTKRKFTNDYITEQFNYFYYPLTDTLEFNQLRNISRPDLVAGVFASYTEPLSEKFSARFVQRVSYSQNEEDVNTYGRQNGKYSDRIDALSNYLKRNQFLSNSRAILNYKLKDLILSAGLIADFQDVKDAYFKTNPAVNRSLFNIMKEFSLSYKEIYLNYGENIFLPSLQNLNPVVNNSNPFSIFMGNPDLEPTKSKFFSANYYKYNPQTSINYRLYANLDWESNAVVTSRIIGADGVQYYQPVNVDGNRSGYISSGVTKDFKNSTGFKFSVSPSFNYSFSRRKVIVNSVVSDAKSQNGGPNLGFTFDWNSKVEFRPSYGYHISSTKYNDPSFTDLKVNFKKLDAELILRPVKSFVFETNLSHYKNSQLEGTKPMDLTMWNAAVTFLFLKDQKGHLKLSVYDILNENNDYTRRVTENYISEYSSNVLQRYFLLTFTYNIRTFGQQNQKVGGRERFFFF